MGVLTEDRQAWCNICGHRGTAFFPERGREGSLCGNCSASARQRALIYALAALLGEESRPLAEWNPHPEVSVFEAAGRGAYPLLLGEKLRYVNTEYRADPARELAPFASHADLERLAYPAESLDFILAADVFEHVRHDDAAFAEVKRVLKPGGCLILTVPYDPDLAETLQRVRVEGDRDVLLMEPEYHGGGGQSLAYRTYGRDLPDRLRAHGFSVGVLDPHGADLSDASAPVFIAVNASSIDLSRFHRIAEPFHTHTVTPLLPFRWSLALRRNLGAARQLLIEVRARLDR